MKTVRKNFRSRAWVFTLNNYTSIESIGITTMLIDLCKYLTFGREVGKEGTKHLQGLIYLKQKRTRSAVSKLPGMKRAYLDIKRGTFKQAREYCQKDGDWFEKGDCPMDQSDKGAASKESYRKLIELAKNGSFNKIMEDHPREFLSRYSTIKNIFKDYGKKAKRLDKIDNLWLYGAPGTGKSHFAREINPESTFCKNKNKWWDNYQNEEVVIIDDFDKNHSCLGSHLKIWSDKYAFSAEVKGSAFNIRPKRIIVTSNYQPTDIWEDEMMVKAIERRFIFKEFIIKYKN